MSLLAHPERNVLVTGQHDTNFADIARLLAIRLDRRYIDIHRELQKRRLMHAATLRPAPRSDEHWNSRLIEELSFQRGIVTSLDLQSLGAIGGLEHRLVRYFVVAVTPGTTGDNQIYTDGQVELNCDLELKSSEFSTKHLARVIAHCLYG